MHVRIRLAAGTALLALATIAQPASAVAENDDQARQPSQEITITGRRIAHESVSATKTATPIVDTPQTIDVVTRQELDARQVETVRGALRYVPGVFISDDGDNRLDTVTARGFALDQYLDGLKLLSGTWSAPKVEPWMLERIEVLKGPSSVLYGQASPAGVLNLVSKRAGMEPTGSAQLIYGSNGFKQAAIDVGGGADADRHFAVRFVGLYRDMDTGIGATKERRIDVAPSLTWNPGDATTVTLLGDYLYDPNGGVWALLPYQGTLLANPNGRISRNFYSGDEGFEDFERRQTSVGYAAEHRFGDHFAVRQNLRYRHVAIDYSAVQGLTLVPTAGAGAPAYSQLTRQAYVARERLSTLAVDTQAEADIATGPLRHIILAGVDHQQVDWDNLTRFGAAPKLNILDPDYHMAIPTPPLFQDARQSLRQTGLYLQDQIGFGRFRILLGGRQDWSSSTTDNRRNATTTRKSDDALTWRAGLVYRIGGLAPYVSYATSFQPQTGVDRTGAAFRPTRGKQWEAGIKYQPEDAPILLSAAAYRLSQDNVLTPDPVSSNFSVQTGQVRSQGVELSAVATLARHLNARASFSYVDNEIRKANDATRGNGLANTPTTQAQLWADYGADGDGLAGFGLGGGIRRQSGMFATNANTVRIPSFTLLDAMIGYDLGHVSPGMKGLRLAVNATNLTDKRYVSYCSAIGCRFGLGRQVLASLQYRW